MLIATIVGLGVFLFLAGLATQSDVSRGEFRLYFGRLLWPSVFLIFIPLTLSNWLANKIIDDDNAYEVFRKNTESLIDNMDFKRLKLVKISMLIVNWISWASVGVGLGCLASRAVYGA
jgi:hypothetical protein